MLSKSNAKWFFLLGTVGFSAAFLGMTVDSMAQFPARSNESAMNDSVVRGKDLWDSNNCMGCHTLLGEGAYYAPELTKVHDAARAGVDPRVPARSRGHVSRSTADGRTTSSTKRRSTT